jgi:ketosteroid isomerase-like protein
MTIDADVLKAERAFFDALLTANVPALRTLLAEDFLLIDLLNESQLPKAALLDALATGKLRFDLIEPADPLVRLYRPTAIVTGRARMAGRFGDSSFEAASRYTHVYTEQDGRWCLVAAQGTPIVPGEPTQDPP